MNDSHAVEKAGGTATDEGGEKRLRSLFAAVTCRPTGLMSFVCPRVERSPTKQHVWRGRLWNCIGLLASFSGLVGLGVLSGHGEVTGAWAPLNWLTSTLVKPLVASTLVKPLVAVVLALVLLVLCALSVRGLRLKYLVRRPGFVEVPDFLAGSPTSVTVAQLSTMFRNNLTTLRLRSLPPVPGVAPETNFIDALESSGTKREDWIGTATALVQRASRPTPIKWKARF